MKANKTDRIAASGEALTKLAFESIGLTFRRQGEADYGIDAHVELISLEEKATGQLLALQIKAGKSYLGDADEDNIVFRTDTSHVKYWINHSLPVVICICDIDNKIVYWQSVNVETAKSTGKGYKILLPKSQTVDKASLSSFRDLLTPIIVENRYTILDTKDQSLATAKRCSFNILLNGTLSKTEIAAIVQQVSFDGRKSSYYRNPITEKNWSEADADVVWVYIYPRLEDVKNGNYVCKSSWISDSLPPFFRPKPFNGENIGNGIILEWNKMYPNFGKLNLSPTLTKGAYLNLIKPFVSELKEVRSSLSLLVDARLSGSMSEAEFMLRTEDDRSRIDAAEMGLKEVAGPPYECGELDQLVQQLSACMSNVALYYSEKGLEIWREEDRCFLSKDQLDNANELESSIAYVLKKIN